MLVLFGLRECLGEETDLPRRTDRFTTAKQCLWAGFAFLLFLPSSLVALLSILAKHKQMGD